MTAYPVLAFLATALACIVGGVLALEKEGSFPAFRVPKQWSLVPDAPIDRSERIRLTIALRRRNAKEMDSIFWSVSDPKSSKYGEHIVDHEAMRQLISPGPAAVGAVVRWLTENGASSVRVGRHEDFVSCLMTLGRIESMLDVHFRMYENKHTHRRIVRAVDAFTLPVSVRSHIEVVAGHNGFPTTARFTEGQKQPTVVHTVNRLGSPQTNVTPAVLYTAFNVTEFPPAPAGQTAVQAFFQAEGQFVNQSDLSLFCELFIKNTPYPVTNLTEQCRVTQYIGNNSNIQPGQNMESSLDSQYILSASGLSETWVYSYLNLDFCGDLLHWAMDVFELHPDGVYPKVISMSYGVQSAPNYCIGPDVPRLAQDVQKMGTMGISVMIASGDDGSGEFYDHGFEYNYGLLAPSFPASIPYCTAVGATTFAFNNSGTQMATTQFGSGGGFSYSYVAPSYQTAQIAGYFNRSTQLPPLGTYNASGRGTPDIALLGEGYNVVDVLVDNPGIGGTSCSTPVFSGFVTLLNHARLAAANKTMGFLNVLLYQNPQLFTDVTTGNNDVSGDGMGWYCAEGWDPVTGLGNPNIGKMIEFVRSLP